MMSWWKWLGGLILLLVVLLTGLWLSLPLLNGFTTKGEFKVSGLSGPVEILRDGKGMPYVTAANQDDLFFGQGFAAAQDRILQMEMARRLAQGRLAELAGEVALEIDRRMRTLGFHRLAARQAEMLAGPERVMLRRYADGVNAFLGLEGELPLEFKLLGLTPEPWRINDSLALYFFMSFTTSANMHAELVNQLLVDRLGSWRAAQIFPLTINPEASETREQPRSPSRERLGFSPSLAAVLNDHQLRLGSNNWAVDGRFTPSGKPILAGDPHLDNRMLPGNFHACGLFSPGFRLVGAIIPGIPGVLVGRNQRVAMAVTNSYGDLQDLYIETPDPADPERYLEGGRSVPFKKVVEHIRIKDSSAPEGYRQETLVVRLTRRGPIVSDLVPENPSGRLLSLRWAPAENLRPAIGIRSMLNAKSARQVQEGAGNLYTLPLNIVAADVEGNLSWQPSGRLPIRSRGGRMLPTPVQDDQDNWIGWIPAEQMPHLYNPERGWLGTANHYSPPAGYPHYYSTYAAPGYRYRRIMELLSVPGVKTVDDHWAFQRDQKNLMAQALAPIMARALADSPDTRHLAEIITNWDHWERPEAAAPAVFQALYITLARLVFSDELGPELAQTFLGNWYLWEKRLERMILAGDSPWFDDVTTPEVKEGLDDIIRKAGRLILADPPGGLKGDPADWRWGRVHQLQMVSPLRRRGWGKTILGSGSFSSGGSGDTLQRGLYGFDQPFAVKYSACLRMVADLGDEEKVTAVLAGGQVDRHFHPHRQDQLPVFMSGGKLYWWFSEQAVREHAVGRLVLTPR